MRRLCADREEKRVTRGSDISGQDGEQEQLDLNDPNQRSLLERCLDAWVPTANATGDAALP
jgi:hypothetical protein